MTTEHRHPRCVTPASGTAPTDAATIAELRREVGDLKLQREADRAEAAATYEAMRARIAELEAIIETMKAEVWEANEDNFKCGRLAAEQGCLVANAPSDAVQTLVHRYVDAKDRIAELEALVNEHQHEDLHPFHDGELSPERAGAFREHLAKCAKCAAGLHDLMQEATATTPRSR